MELQTVDALIVQVLVDNVTDNLSSIPSGVTHEISHLRKHGMQELSGTCLCCGAHGLSLLITAIKDNATHTLLFDAGPEGEVFKRNVQKLSIDLSKVEDIVLSHGHWDHAGGFLSAVDLIKSHGSQKIISFHVNPDMFVKRGTQTTEGHVHPFTNIPSIEELTSNRIKIVNEHKARLIGNNLFYLSGDIPRITDYEKGFPEHVKQIEGTWLPDPLIMDERFLAVNVRNKGLVVFSACSHAGVINVLSSAKALFPDLPLHTIMGGFHLSGSSVEKIIPQTVDDLQQFNLQMIVPAHCTGFRAVTALINCFGDNIVVPSAVGRTFQV